MKFLIIFLILLCSSAQAQELPPGSFTYQYGGLYKVIVKESNRFFKNKWRDQEIELLDNGNVNYTTFIRRQIHINSFLNDWRYGPPWWTRGWMHSMAPQNGGAPEEITIFHKGSSYLLVNTPLFSLSNSLEFKWKSIQASIDFKKASPMMIAVGDIPAPKFGLKMRFSPELRFSTSTLLRNPSKAIRRIGLNIGVVYSNWSKQLLAFDINIWLRPNDKEALIGLAVYFLQW